MYDSVDPGKIPATAEKVALYRNGLYAADPATWGDKWPRVYWIDVLGNDPVNASILDVETGDAHPYQVSSWCDERLADHPDWLCRIYCNLSTWPAVKSQVATMPQNQRRQVRYWIANPTGQRHYVPGSAATQYEWAENWDLSAVRPSWDT